MCVKASLRYLYFNIALPTRIWSKMVNFKIEYKKKRRVPTDLAQIPKQQ